jgi:hypothetical protein
MKIQENPPMGCKLVHFASFDPVYNFYATVNVQTDDEVIRQLAMAAIGEANREDEANGKEGSAGCNDGLPVRDSIKARLIPLGFKFFAEAETTFVGPWDDTNQSPTLIEVRLNHAGIEWQRSTLTRMIEIETLTGTIAVDMEQGKWVCLDQGTHCSFRGNGVSQLIDLVHLRGQPSNPEKNLPSQADQPLVVQPEGYAGITREAGQ